MREVWNKSELSAVMACMREFERRCNELANAIGDKRLLARHEREEIERLYKDLKFDLKEAGRYGTLSGRREPVSRIESAFYEPAVRKAHIALRPATNSNPVTSRWASALWEAALEFSYYLHQMDDLAKQA